MSKDKKVEKFNWEVPKYPTHKRTRIWYISASVVAGLLIIYSLFTFNFLFLFIIIMSSAIIILNDKKDKAMVNILIDNDGIIVGKKLHNFDEIKDFSILYKPKEDIKNLYFEFNNTIKPRLSLPLEKQNPLLIRDFLLKYLPEDLERTDLPFSEGIARTFKL